jgi:catechol 2,3-dioxygenase-like lactoylglutathione lyase family enzyme
VIIDHVGFEVSDLTRSAAMYDPLFFALGVRRAVTSERAIAYGDNHPAFWLVQRGALPGPSYGHVALRASGRAAVDAAYAAALAAGGRDDGPPGPRPQYGPRYYAAYLRDPDGLRVEIVTGSR